MQLNSSYLYPNKIELYQNLDSWKTERWHQVYQRKFYLYKGVDNRLDLHIKNSDQKGRNITGYTVVFNILAIESGELVVSKQCSEYDVTTGRVFANFNEQDLWDIKPGFYHFSAYTLKDGIKTPLYGDSQHGASGTLEVRTGAFEQVVESTELLNFSKINNDYFSSVVDAKPQFNSNSGLHTFAFYMDSFSGNVTIQGTLEDSTDPLDWVDIETITYANSGLTYKNITGVWGKLRIKHTLENGSLDKVLYRY